MRYCFDNKWKMSTILMIPIKRNGLFDIFFLFVFLLWHGQWWKGIFGNKCTLQYNVCFFRYLLKLSVLFWKFSISIGRLKIIGRGACCTSSKLENKLIFHDINVMSSSSFPTKVLLHIQTKLCLLFFFVEWPQVIEFVYWIPWW